MRPHHRAALVRTALLLLLLTSLVALARGGGGQFYSGGHSFSGGHSYSGGGGGGGIDLIWVILFCIQHPLLAAVFALAAFIYIQVYNTQLSPTARTIKALDLQEAERRTTVGFGDVQGWVNALKLKDPQFELAATLDQVHLLFFRVQECWTKAQLDPLRPFVSDAVYQRFKVQLELMKAQGVRNVMVDVDAPRDRLQLVGLDQSAWFDTIRVAVHGFARDIEVPLDLPQPEAEARARRAPLDEFIEVWSFVRKPGAHSRAGAGLDAGRCPNCGAPFQGGATNDCPFCKAVVNSGNYDWTLAEITQGSEATRRYELVDGLAEAHQVDPALNLEMLEDRASLIFWKWIEAQTANEPRRLAKLATSACLEKLQGELGALRASGRHRVFMDCAVGAVKTRVLRFEGTDSEQAHLELRWSAKMALAKLDQQVGDFPMVPRRHVFLLIRKPGARTNTSNGLSTSRCPKCNAPLSDSLTSKCDFCGAELSSGEQNWVLAEVYSFDSWNTFEDRRYTNVIDGQPAPVVRRNDAVADVQERGRILFLMAAMATADGVVEPSERRLLKMCAQRWGIPWAKVEQALSLGPSAFEQLISRGSPEAATVLTYLVKMALVDGRIDRRERQMLVNASARLGLGDRLDAVIRDQATAAE